ncbi:MAG: hypothetical protein ACFCD0_20330 [Gemmataceae bacterium]
MKLYPYVGPPEIRERCREAPQGSVIVSTQDLRNWLQAHYLNFNEESVAVLTFVIDQHEQLRIAERNSEHVACVGGKPVFSAGEMFIRINRPVIVLNPNGGPWCHVFWRKSASHTRENLPSR